MNDNQAALMQLAVAILASAVENDEIFNVSKVDVENILDSMAANKTWPIIKVYEDDGRIKYGVELIELEEK